jgi:hypothetical protein
MAINMHTGGFPPWVSSHVDIAKDEVSFCVTHGHLKHVLTLPRYRFKTSELHNMLWSVKRALIDEQAKLDAVTARLTQGTKP